MLASQFGPKVLRRVRDKMIQPGLARSSINIHVGRIRRLFKWAVAEELVPVELYQRLCALTGLEAGRSAARESEPVGPVSQEMINAVRPFVSRQVWGMIQVQLASAMRPGEVTQMRGSDLKMSGTVWSYTPLTHKTSHHGKQRVIFLGKRAQKIINQFLKPELQAVAPRVRTCAARGRMEIPDSCTDGRRKRRGLPRRPNVVGDAGSRVAADCPRLDDLALQHGPVPLAV